MRAAKSYSRKTIRDAAPKFLLFLKYKERSDARELPAKYSTRIEVGVLILFVALLFAIVTLIFRIFQKG